MCAVIVGTSPASRMCSERRGTEEDKAEWKERTMQILHRKPGKDGSAHDVLCLCVRCECG
jgi:hypothetical protein